MTSEITDSIDQSFVCGKSSVSRAELLWGFSALDSGQHEQIADILGFERYPEPSRNNDQPDTGIQPDPGKTDEDNASDLIIDPPPVTATSSSYYRITSRAIDQTQNDTGTDELSLPDWLTQASPTLLTETATRVPACHQVKPLYTELADWSRVLPFLQKVLGGHVEGRRPDTARLVEQVAYGEMIRRIPRRQRYNWSSKARILIDINDENFPYRRDFLQLRNQLIQLRGDDGLEVQYIYDEPGGAIARYDQQREIIEPWRLPAPDTPILILSDLAMQSRSRQSLYGWLAFGQMLNAQGWRTTVLMPVAERNIDHRLMKYFDCVAWDRVSRFKLVKGDYQPEKDRRNHADSIDRLLSYFFAGVRVDSGLLRAIRYLVPGGYDIGHETEIWRHQVVVHEGDEWGWLADSKSGYLTDAQRSIAGLSFEQKQKLVELVGRYHAQYPDELYFEAMYNLKLLGLTLPDDVDAATETFMQDMVATYRDNPDNSLLHGWVKRHLARHEAPTWRHKHDYWLPFLAFAKMRDARLKGKSETEWPEDMTQSEIETALRYINQTQIRQLYVLRQQGEKLEMASGHTVSLTTPDDWESHSQSGALVLKLWLEDTRIFHIHDDGQGYQRVVSLELDQDGERIFRLPTGGQHIFQIGRERITTDVMAPQQQKQDWMQFIGSGSEGLYVESMNQQNEVCRWYWHPPEWDASQGMLSGFWFYLPVSADTLKPDWATDAGRDQYGLYADAEIVGVIQRFRWIEPNSFMMGSPEDEAGRFNNETQHQVNLTQGYWLADTACTKELWEAVKHLNPNIFFKGKKQPIKNISWNDIKHFFDQIEEKHPELKLRLPTEAEWENACRAGTETAFHFGSDIALDQVNYRGTWDDYGSWGRGALQKIAAVKSYPPNAWGLYEMHGNVWEWCQDWHGEYPSEPVTDPQGPDTGGRRVLRGGSWYYDGRDCRSACRSHDDPSYRGGNNGFRLARGHELNPVRTVRAGRQPADRSATERAKAQAGDGLRGSEKEKGMFDSIKDFLKR